MTRLNRPVGPLATPSCLFHRGLTFVTAFSATVVAAAVMSLPVLTQATPAEPQGAYKAPRLMEATTRVDLHSLPLLKSAKTIAKADAHIEKGRYDAAKRTLKPLGQPAARLLRARMLRLQSNWRAARSQLRPLIGRSHKLGPLVAFEEGLIALGENQPAKAIHALLPLLDASPALAAKAIPHLIGALRSEPKTLLEHTNRVEKALEDSKPEVLTAFLAAKHHALTQLERTAEADAIALRLFLEFPTSEHAPESLPERIAITPAQRVERAEHLLDAHQNETVLADLGTMPTNGLLDDLRCRRQFAQGLAARKLRRYATAEGFLTDVVRTCQQDEVLLRRASYLQAKVISIRDGLRAIKPIKRFKERFNGHSMVDDVLFWAGDLYQRRGRDSSATRYYQEAAAQTPKGDYCGESRWRIAWMAYRRNDFDAAAAALHDVFAEDGCASSRFHRSRAHYWLGRIAEQRNNPVAAELHYRALLENDPVSYYGQQGRARLRALAPPNGPEWTDAFKLPKPVEANPLCPENLANSPSFQWGYNYLLHGLNSDAADELEAAGARQAVLGGSHAAAQGLKAKVATTHNTGALATCGPAQGKLLLAMLLYKAGAEPEAHWRLRTDFAETLNRFPTPLTLGLWRAAYPLAFRDMVAAAEKETGLPPYFLQALIREESAFDPDIVSWAGAYGLTQLLLESAKQAGNMMRPRFKVTSEQDLLVPAQSIRLGGTMLAYLYRRYGDHLGLTLGGYNAGQGSADKWWKRYQGLAMDVFAEEMTIRETREYVKRVLRTWGIYKWLYDEQPLVLTATGAIPPRD